MCTLAEETTRKLDDLSNSQRARLSLIFASDAIELIEDAMLRVTNPVEYTVTDLEIDLESAMLLVKAIRNNLELICQHQRST